MPFIQVTIGALTKEQKENLIKKMTAAAAEVTHIPSEFFMVAVQELPDGNIGIGGKTIERTKTEYQSKNET